MKRYNFKVHDEDKDLQQFLDSLIEKNEFSSTIRTVLKFVKENGLEELQTVDSLKIEKLKADIRYKNFQSEFIQLRMKYDYAFDSKPSKNAVHAMKEGAQIMTGYDSPEGKKIEDIIEKKWNNYVSQLRDKGKEWVITCRLCDVAFLGFTTKEKAIERLKKHLEESHERELVEAQMK